MEKELQQAVKKLLRKAATLIQKKGLAKGIRADEKGRHCVLGALDEAAGYSGVYLADQCKSPEWKAAVERLAVAIQHGKQTEATWRAAEWNNNPARKKSEVVGLLRKVAAL